MSPVSGGSSTAAGGLQNCADGKPQVTPITMIKTSRFTVSSIITGDSTICINVQQMTTYHIRSHSKWVLFISPKPETFVVLSAETQDRFADGVEKVIQPSQTNSDC